MNQRNFLPDLSDRQQRIELIGLIILSGFILAAFFHYIQGYYLERGYPFNTFLFYEPFDNFKDYLNPIRGSADLNPYEPIRITYIGGYFPFGYFVTFLYSLIHPWPFGLQVFLFTFLVFLAMYTKINLFPDQQPLTRQLLYILIFTFLTYPVFHLIDRSNFDTVMFMLIVLSLYAYRKQRYSLSAILLACTIAMKAYTGIFLVLFICDRRYKELLLCALAVFLLTLGSLALFKDGLFAEYQKMLLSFGNAFKISVGRGSNLRFSSSLYTLIVMILNPLHPGVHAEKLFQLGYMLLAFTVFAVGALRVLREKIFWKRVAILILLMILLPFASNDYRLVFLFIPMYMFINSGIKTRADAALTILFGLLLIPKNYFVFYNDQNIGMVINPLLLLALLILLVTPASRAIAEPAVNQAG